MISNDVTAEMAALSGRGPNGRPASVTEMMRPTLTRSSSGFVDSASLEEALRAQEADEQARMDEKDRKAKAEYAAYLEYRERNGMPPPPMDVEQPEPFARSGFLPPPQPPAPSIGVQQVAEKIRQDYAAKPASSPVVARAIAEEDLDRLWDWIRADRDGSDAFFGGSITRYQQLLAWVQTTSQHHVIRSFDVQGKHGGVFVVSGAQQGFATLAVYYAPPMRQYIAQLLPYILGGAKTITGNGIRLALSVSDDVAPIMRELLRPYGFSAKTLFLEDAK